MNEKALGVIAIVFALIAMAIGGYVMVYNTGEKGETGLIGPQGDIGPIGPTGGEQGLPGEDGEDGEQGPSGGQGAPGPTGPPGSSGNDGTDGINGTDGEDGIDGTNGEDGEDCEPNGLPVVTDVTPIGCIGLYDDWIFSITIDDPEDDLMKIEFYIYVDTAWFEGTGCPFEDIPYFLGDYVWIPILNEVGYDGTYSFNGTAIKDFINWEIVEIPECMDLKWRYDVTDRVVSDEPVYETGCYIDNLNFEAHHCYDGYTNFTVKIDGILIYTHDTIWNIGWESFTIDLGEFDILCCCEPHTIKFEVLTHEDICFEPCGELAIDWISLTPSCCEGYVNIGDTNSEIGNNLLGWGPIGDSSIACCDWSDCDHYNWRHVWAGSEDEPWASIELTCHCGPCVC